MFNLKLNNIKIFVTTIVFIITQNNTSKNYMMAKIRKPS